MVKYYYVTLSDSPHGDLRAILKSDSQNITSFVGLQENPQKFEEGPQKWEMPNGLTGYFKKGTTHEGQNEIVIKQEELQGCFNKFDMNDYNKNKKKRSCGLIFGVQNNISVDTKDKDKSVEYKFVLFENIIRLEN